MIGKFLLAAASVYLIGGFLFAIPFLILGVGRIDPHAAHGSWGFRLLITPGTILLWPLLAARWMRGMKMPPEEKNAHRCAASTRGRV